jgi:hypothetical protein
VVPETRNQLHSKITPTRAGSSNQIGPEMPKHVPGRAVRMIRHGVSGQS